MKCAASILPLCVALVAFVPVQAASASPAAAAPEGIPAQFRSLIYRSNGVYSLQEAASAGDVAVLQARLDEGENPNRVDEAGNSPLHLAACGGSLRALNLLLEAGADPLATDVGGRTPRQLCQDAAMSTRLQLAEEGRYRELELEQAIAQKDEAAVRRLLGQGVSPNARTGGEAGYLLHLAVAEGQGGMVQALIEAGANVNVQHPDNRCTPLHLASSQGRVEIIRSLLAAGANPMLQSGNGSYPLHDAIWNRKLEAVRALLPAYASINFSPMGGPHGSPLSMAIFYGRAEVLQAFLEAGFNPNDPALRREPPLILAVCQGHEACVKLLLAAGADRGAKDACGKTAADYATAALAPLLK